MSTSCSLRIISSEGIASYFYREYESRLFIIQYFLIYKIIIMKKVHFKFLSSMSLLLLLCCFLVSSCTSDNNITELSDQKDFTFEKGILLPMQFNNLPEHEIEQHMTQMTKEQELLYINNYIVGQYLSYIDKAVQVASILPDSENLSTFNLTEILSKSELEELNSHLIPSLPELETRSCVTRYFWHWCCYHDHNGVCVATWCPNGCWPPNCGC